jgi:CDP-glucose 4,6-dehydratase
MHVLVTGHTGFKGAWLALWLKAQGHDVSGISLPPLSGSLFEIARVSDLVTTDLRIDIRDTEETKKAVKNISPDLIFHFAAQPLVRESYKDPRFTFETNAMGTLNVLEAVSSTPSVKAHVVITTDKVYRNINQAAGYIESDPLGGEDPYSASKAMADILTHSWISSFPGVPTAIVRAGNVIGGGDVSPDRLLPDLINFYSKGIHPTLRYPESVRPWQHVLDCLNGYLVVSEKLLSGESIGEINIGPGPESFVTVGAVANLVADLYGIESGWELDSGERPHEAGLLALDASKAKTLLSWNDKLKFNEAVNWTVEWHKRISTGEDPRSVTLDQISNFEAI